MLRRPAPRFAVLALLAGVRLGAQNDLIPAGELAAPPTPARLDALAAAGAGGHWKEVALAARDASFKAYGKNQLSPAEAWHYVQGWSAIFGETEAAYIPVWDQAIEVAKVRHTNMPATMTPHGGAMGNLLAPELRRWLLGQVAFSAEFFSLINRVDFLPKVLGLLNEIHQADPVRFREYPSLALAIAVVYDVPPPLDWPHWQVKPDALPRRWPSAVAAFAWWAREDKEGRTYQRLGRLRAEELKFVVDVSATFSELDWSKQTVHLPLSALPQAYTAVRYRLDRVQGNVIIWPGPTYRLADILATGGICVDQAYFATQVGKARGVPTLLFIGSGRDGRHAWFGYLDENLKWQLDAGRYADQQFTTGLAYDPQTWQQLSDHEIQFFAERFRALPSYRQSCIHAAFAEQFLQAGRTDEAFASARKAVNYERRNADAWETLLEAQAAQGVKPSALEATLREATIAFQRYPDLEAGFANRLIASLRARGETSQADAEDQRIAHKYQGNRSDLSVQQAAEMLLRSFKDEAVTAQVRTYNTVLATFGRDAGMEFFDEVVTLFANHLLELHEPGEAVKAVERARLAMTVEPGKQLDRELGKLLQRLKDAEARH